MELDAEEGAGARLRDAALRPGRGRGRVGGERVREVEGVADGVDRRPADARDAALAEPPRAAGQQAEALDAAVLLRVVERELEPEADAERRLGARAERLVDAGR